MSKAETTTGEGGPGDWIAIARILRPQGRKGEVLAELLTDQLSQFEAGRAVRLLKAAQPAKQAEAILESHWLPTGKSAGRIVLKLGGVNSISEAELLTGVDVMIPSADLAELEADTFYVKDLLGCTVRNGERVLGKVVDVQFATSTDGRIRLEDAAPLLAVEADGQQDSEPVLIPLVRAYLESVDLSARSIVMKLPAGLVEMQQHPDASSLAEP